MIWIFIAIVLVMFLFFVFAMNPEKFKIKAKPKKEKQPKDEEKKPEKEPDYTYSEYQPVKVDTLGSSDESIPYSTLKEEEQNASEDKNTAESENSERLGGRKAGDIKSKEIAPVEVEDLGEYDVDAQTNYELDTLDDLEDIPMESEESNLIFDDDFEDEEDKTLSEEIQNLSPELKVLLIDNVLNKKVDDDKK